MYWTEINASVLKKFVHDCSFEASHQSRHFLTACHTTEGMKVLAAFCAELKREISDQTSSVKRPRIHLLTNKRLALLCFYGSNLTFVKLFDSKFSCYTTEEPGCFAMADTKCSIPGINRRTT